MSTSQNKFASGPLMGRAFAGLFRAAPLACLLATTLTVALPPAALAHPSSGAKPSPAERRVPDADPETAWLVSVLTADAVAAETRRGAAVRLLTAPKPSALDALRRALDGDRPSVLAAVVEAMAEAQQWPTAIVDRVRPHLSQMLADAAASDLTRESVVAALGRVPTRDSLEALIAVLERTQPTRDADRRLAANATASLERLTKRGFGTDHDAWIDWWDENRLKHPDELLEPSAEALRAQRDHARSTAEARRIEIEQLSQRLAALHIEFLAQPLAESRQDRNAAQPGTDPRSDRIARMLIDPVTAVRRAAVEHVDRSFPSVQVPNDTVHAALVQMADDSEPSLRSAAVRLLDRINRPRLSEMLAPAFAREKNAEVLQAHLAILRRLPTPAAEAPLIRIVSGQEGLPAGVVDDAARALVTVAETGGLSDGAPQAIRDALSPIVRVLLDDLDDRTGSGSAQAMVPGAGTLRLFTVVCNEGDLARMAELLRRGNGSSRPLDPSARRGIAEGLRHRGLQDILVTLADDDAVYPALMRSLSDAPVTLDSFARIVELTPAQNEPDDSGRAGEWRRAVVRAMAALPPEDLLAADDTLAALAADAAANGRYRATRRDALVQIAEQPTAERPGGAIDSERYGVLVRRGATVELELGNPSGARRLLDRLPSTDHPETRMLRFRSLVLSAEYVAALEASNDPKDPTWWIDLLAWTIDRRMLDAATVLVAEINRTFGPLDNPEHIEQVDRALALLNPVEASRETRGEAPAGGSSTGPSGRGQAVGQSAGSDDESSSELTEPADGDADSSPGNR